MAKKSKTGKPVSKKDYRKNIELKIADALSFVKKDFSVKKFQQLVKKATRLFSTEAPKPGKPKKKKTKIPVIKSKKDLEVRDES